MERHHRRRQAVAPKPVNVLVGTDFRPWRSSRRCGVRRISVGGALARLATTVFLEAAREIAERGTFTSLNQTLPFAELNERFR